MRQAFALGSFPSVVKEAMQLAGMKGGRCRRPIGPMSTEARYKLAAVVESIRAAGYLPTIANVAAR